jgi:hypothetical protein
MDPRLAAVLARLQATRYADLSGSEAYTVIRIGDGLLNEAVAAFAASAPAVRTVTIHARGGNLIDVQLKLAKPAFLPAISLTLEIERQPQLPQHPEIVLRVVGLGGLMRLAGPSIRSSGALPPGLRLEGERLYVDVRHLLQTQGRADLLDFAEQLQVVTENGRLVVAIQLRIR